MEQLHSSTLQVLDEIGFKYESEKVLKLLEEHGCRVDHEKRIARIPPDLVEWAIRKTPSSFMVRARDPEKSIRLGGNTVYFMNSAGARYADVDTGEVTMPSLEQNNEAVIVSDALEKCKYQIVPQVPRQIAEGTVRSAMVAPIVRNKKCYGALYTDNAKEHEHYTTEELDYLIFLSIIAAVRLERL